MRRGETIKTVVSFYILIINLILLLQEDSATEMTKFLENIRQTIKKAVETMKKRKTRKEGKNRSFFRLKARKQIIQKLATPFVFRPQHMIIKYNKTQQNTQDKQQSKGTENQVQKSETLQNIQITAINRFLRQNPALMPFKFHDIRQFLSKLSQPKKTTFKASNTSSSTFTTSATIDYSFLDALHDWYIQFLKGMLDFWLFFKKFFIDNPEGFKYLKHNICVGEIIEGIGGNEIILLPSPGLGYLDSKLLNEIALKLNKLEMEKYQFKNDLTNILRNILQNPKNNIFCNASVFKNLLGDQTLQEILNIPIQNIISTIDDSKKYQILLNLPSIAKGSIQNTPLLKGRTYNDMTNFISAWTSKLNYLDYQLYSYFMSYKVDKCSGKITNNFNEWFEKEISAGMDPTKRFYECIYKDKEFRKCLNNSYKTDSGEIDSNYKALRELIDKFFNSISDRIELSNIDQIVIQLGAIRNKKQYEIWPEIIGVCETVKNTMLIPMERCQDINQLDLEYIKQLTFPPLSLQLCPHSQKCKLCYTVNTNAGTVYIPTFDTCGNCDNEEECKGNTSNKEKCPKNFQCYNTASIITGLIITYIPTTSTDENLQNTINEFKNNWDYLIKMLQNKVCKYEGIDENFCKDIENKTMDLIVFTPQRNSHKKSLEKLLGKDTYNFLEEKIRSFIENPDTTNINCNDL